MLGSAESGNIPVRELRNKIDLWSRVTTYKQCFVEIAITKAEPKIIIGLALLCDFVAYYYYFAFVFQAFCVFWRSHVISVITICYCCLCYVHDSHIMEIIK